MFSFARSIAEGDSELIIALSQDESRPEDPEVAFSTREVQIGEQERAHLAALVEGQASPEEMADC